MTVFLQAPVTAGMTSHGEMEAGGFDAIVIGSGRGGATVARELSRHGIRTLILERGTGAPIEGTVLQSIALALTPGRSLLFTQELLALVCGLTVGGSSILAYATAFEPPYEMFKSHGIDLGQEVERIKKELPIAPLADELVGPAARRIMASARELGYAWSQLPKIVYQGKCRPRTVGPERGTHEAGAAEPGSAWALTGRNSDV